MKEVRGICLIPFEIPKFKRVLFFKKLGIKVAAMENPRPLSLTSAS
jgi:hypothetical protein